MSQGLDEIYAQPDYLNESEATDIANDIRKSHGGVHARQWLTDMIDGTGGGTIIDSKFAAIIRGILIAMDERE